jgi:hypothetical protein
MKEQIEEMGKLCPFYEEGKCNLLEDEAAECNFDCDMCDFARTLYNAGYRKQKEGEWVERIEKPDWLEDDVDVFYECSVCETKSPAPTNYCPNCGAHMRGGKNE